MSGMIVKSLTKCIFHQNTTYSVARLYVIQQAKYAVAAPKKGAPSKSGKKFEVETDADVLCTRLCGGNIYKEGEDPVLGKDEDYPEWLWKLKTERTFVPLEELDEEDPLYWRRLRKLAFRNNNKLKGLSKF
ncbi:39S ribosomal protein L54, mitochondrial-like [Mya arenaria]|uniref:39S ribosomal protein L54, mitochondrial-like n=1 Tax=Mya arenaria TaxID=6604 RepID=UPI0022E4A67D|nr:39S ribosomal protein L54, mitochondrial-like [Mya arenaria]